jgi:endonuclease YncB( thermonuclease family)
MFLSVDVLTPVLMCTLKLRLQMRTDYRPNLKKMLPGKCFVCHLCQGFVSQRGRSVTVSGRLFRDGTITFALLALIGLLALKMSNQPETVKSGAFYAIDGDTLEQGGERLRLLGIDAPEYRQQCERRGSSWPCGRAARDMLVKLLGHGAVDCRGDRRDRYGRLLVTCQMGKTDINGEMVLYGMAVSYGGYGSEEARARETKSGLWAGTFERPQDYRREEAQRSDNPFAGFAGILKRFSEWN